MEQRAFLTGYWVDVWESPHTIEGDTKMRNRLVLTLSGYQDLHVLIRVFG